MLLDFLSILEEWMPHVMRDLDKFYEAIWETVYMLGMTAVIAGFFGLVIGVLMVVTAPRGLWENRGLYQVLDYLINIFRSIPFIILIALLSGLTRLIVHDTIGPTAALVPLVIGTVPFFARQVEIALLEVKPGVIEAAQAMGLSPMDIIIRVYLREGLPALLRVSASTVINVIGLTAMAGAVGGGGLGTMAIARGYNRNRMDIIIVSTLLILLLVAVSQLIFNRLIKAAEHHHK
ncbi:methionine ABC transporter permease [Vaginisenegalia massiliensis]|uniref:methionine ABC transporter permease n=1 Tax=Vaginisenegalia massiliensis TaxID=2058294 RepID=UPI000F52EFEE|nr:methionine ABC transporter permease [Vaginisenegalia massiliensis]